MSAPGNLLALELGALGVVLLAALVAGRPLARIARAGLHGLDRLARRPLAAELACFVLAAGGAAATALCVQRPHPRVHDEFSYLLAADTFAHGRVANPKHPLWEHFEAFHTFQDPVYASKYPPAQGALLATGQALTGDPTVGLWLSAGLLAAAAVWMLRAWTTPRYAALGGLVVALLFGVASYWSQSFWGGAVAATAGMVVFGALPRIRRGAGVGAALALGVGVAVLAQSRPFEGALATLPVALALVPVLRRPGALARTVAPLVAVAALLVAFQGWYDARLTGDATVLPYRHHETLYAVAPSFVFQEVRPTPDYASEDLRRFWTGDNFLVWDRQRDPRVFAEEALAKLRVFWRFHLGLVLTLPALLGLAALRRRPLARVLAASLVLTLVGWLFSVYPNPHYVAPVTAVAVVFTTLGLRRLVALSRARGIGAALALGLVAIVGAQTLAQVATRGRPADDWALRRAALVERLEASGEQHLVLVDHSADLPPHVDWVANGADLEGTPVLWARDLGLERNAALVAHCSGRRAWKLSIGFAGVPEEPRPYE